MHRNKSAACDLPEIVSCVRGFHRDEDAVQFVRELLTPAEIEDFALRWRLLKRLDAGLPQRKISQQLGISLCKITRGSRILKKKDSKVKISLRSMK